MSLQRTAKNRVFSGLSLEICGILSKLFSAQNELAQFDLKLSSKNK
jgi:hypothetical protein